MDVVDYGRFILEGDTICHKLFSGEEITFGKKSEYIIPSLPGRPKSMQISGQTQKFPSKKGLFDPKNVAKAMHFFANHELLAIEIMAAVLCYFPHDTDELIKFKKGIIKTLKDEQKHLKLYQDHIEKQGVALGDFALNGFFWNYLPEIKTPAEYLSVMALTFEAANLDFASFYAHIFESFDDKKSADIMWEVYKDEVSHVAFGRKYLDLWRKDQSLWDYYISLLPEKITPARSKGQVFNSKSRQQAGLTENFIKHVQNYEDGYRITKRKEWNS